MTPTQSLDPAPDLPRPTDAELAILRVLWDRGPSTVREIRQELERERPTGYNTVLKLLQIMLEKGLVTRNERFRSHIYEASVPAEQTQGQLLDHLLEGAFAGSASQLVLRALARQRASDEELAQIRSLLDTIEGELS